MRTNRLLKQLLKHSQRASLPSYALVQQSKGWMLFLLSLLLPTMASLSAEAYEFRKPYAPPEVLHHRYYRTRCGGNLRVNLNRADLTELQTLPGMDESTALKVIRIRRQEPLRSFEDLSRLPFLDPQKRQRLIQRIQPLSEF